MHLSSTEASRTVHLDPPSTTTTPPLVIEPTHGWRTLDFKELWRYRELLFFLTWRDVSVRYKQTVLGVAWAVIQPLFIMIVFTIFFGRLGGIDQKIGKELSYSLFAFSGLLPWMLFAYAFTEVSKSMVTNRNLITKVYFPRLIVPLAPLLSGLVDFAIAAVLFTGMMVWYQVTPGWPIILLPFFILMALITSLAVGLWLAALNAIYRDVQYTLTFLTQLWMFLTPIAYPSTIVPEQWRWLYGLNPMAGVVDGFRWALFGTAPPGPMMAASFVMMLLLLVGGLYYFRRMERTFADVV